MARETKVAGSVVAKEGKRVGGDISRTGKQAVDDVREHGGEALSDGVEVVGQTVLGVTAPVLEGIGTVMEGGVGTVTSPFATRREPRPIIITREESLASQGYNQDQADTVTQLEQGQLSPQNEKIYEGLLNERFNDQLAAWQQAHPGEPVTQEVFDQLYDNAANEAVGDLLAYHGLDENLEPSGEAGDTSTRMTAQKVGTSERHLDFKTAARAAK